MATWYCCRQRAGPLVKEFRRTGVRFSPDDTAEDRRLKTQAKKLQRCVLNREAADRLELRLALFWWTGTHYTLTYDDEHLPRNFADVRKTIRAFLMLAGRWRASRGIEEPLDYIYAIEGLHGERRYHVHFICDYYDISPAEMRPGDGGWRGLWRNGIVFDTPVIKDTSGYRDLAEYLNKERPDGYIIPIGRHPWSCSRSLSAKVPQPERWTERSGAIEVPDSAVFVRRFDPARARDDFGGLNWARYLIPDTSRACARACARARQSCNLVDI